MLIPLDYYRILGVLPQVTDKQLNQAYHDRCLQSPRREYSKMAILSRKQLLTQAYEILSDSEQRAAHEALCLENTFSDKLKSNPEISLTGQGEEILPDSSPLKPKILEIAPEQWIGSLMILQELGEYELVIKFGEIFLETLSNPRSELHSSICKIQPDVILTIALAALELSREQWQQEEYEQAGISGGKGLSILQENCLFPSLQLEITKELYKLRPYRILELLAQPNKNRADRDRGKTLLQEMLEERQGIDGQGDDHSGLGIDDFLRFIQQLRTYLTASEQEDIFYRETNYRSAVTAYLRVYSLIARGFVEKQPTFIVEAKGILDGLEKLQDVSLEKGICALLLGETQEAILALEQCEDEEVLAFIRQQSRGAPDLLPGLCSYGQYWLHTEVFSHFRDFKKRTDSLEDYFADQAVQIYLEQISLDSQKTSFEEKQDEEKQENEVMFSRKISRNDYVVQERRSFIKGRHLRQTRFQHQEPQLLVSGGGGIPTIATAAPVPRTPYRRRFRENSSRVPRDKSVITTSYQDSLRRAETDRSFSLPTTAEELEQKPQCGSYKRTDPYKTGKTIFKFRPWFLVVTSLIVLGAVGSSVKWIQYIVSPLVALEEEQLVLELRQPPIAIPVPETQIKKQIKNQTETLTIEDAKQVVEMWLLSKADAFGLNHNLESLNNILTTPLLSLWKGRAQNLKKYQEYWQYKHNVTIKSLKIVDNNPDKVVVEADIREIANFYQGGQRNASRSYDDQLKVRYGLLRKQNNWLIDSLELID
ncbi:IMS domain-containing protein [cyanobacterium endosymbiont of Epithemia turgida]|uniref:IMS domain-containing protein n=1 Tax=cyanobacterium endosymbiont of Epithemia turgida TaxID=718217 RepID=UPI0004D13541|nr:IMS domain-containing protein [cyanobacterium endosymbiont of Epithemia turgida]BAP17337.1 molecular chaperone DnaJ [cyanobacterium endosymbiont of Epithemia turgida isolate EtSB Lake Yunoko]